MAKITAIIPTFNCLKYLTLCLDSLRQFSTTNPDILVVVDGSTDGTVEYLQSQGIPYLYRWEKKRPGSEKEGGTRPQLIRRCYANLDLGGLFAQSDVLFFGNDDTVFSPRWDEKLLPYADTHQIVVNQIVEPGVEVPPWHGILQRNFGANIKEFNMAAWTAFAKTQDVISLVETFGLNIGLMCKKQFFMEQILVRGGWYWLDNPPENMWQGFKFARVCSTPIYHFSGRASRGANDAV